MKLAIFTPGAYIWPVHRSFEGFISSLGSQHDSSRNILHSQLYPIAAQQKLKGEHLSGELGNRLQKLHRDIYDALLRPSEVYAGNPAPISTQFWPDLAGTPVAGLLEALMFFFLRRSDAEVSITRGLGVFRALFFNHESAEPEHWLVSALRRTAAERRVEAGYNFNFDAPAATRVNDLAFVIVADYGHSPAGTGLLTGRIRRSGSRLVVNVEAGLDPGIADNHRSYLQQIEAESRLNVCRIFGWADEVAA